ncbi:peroxiredoxin [Parasphingorhabdus halotolerans]|uniref:thioredoxin-dependent peroxiredoxin n=1 Tax=Parasphingorhabdus halotolerans TaxID=2725558 RepID=A0A6H2DJQ6_9SPHN|nr:peroxiredoxin [Parasphingorhabdus halotolerans]QJB68912.1 peroxiredoxin [Parasphingorhabdus halotolerans]
MTVRQSFLALSALTLSALPLSLASAPAAQAALKEGAQAMDFTTQAALSGKAFTFSLAKALKKGPVVLYFYPKAFTSGCTIEANQFAEATPELNAMGATVIGVSADNIETLKRFSVEECRNKFAVAVGSKKVIKAYDANLPVMGGSNRTTYIIAPDGKVIWSYSSLNVKGHVPGALAGVKAWKDAMAGK